MNLLPRIEEKGGIQGLITFQNFAIDTPRADQIDQLLASGNYTSRQYHRLLRELAQISTPRTLSMRNQIILAARAEMAKQLCGTQAYTGTISYGALGSGSTAIADANTQLATEVARVAVGVASQTDDEATIDFYFSKSSTNGTYQEFGCFIDGTTSANSGLLFNRALTGGWTKSALEGMTVSVAITFNHA
jgi:hypothetical protein